MTFWNKFFCLVWFVSTFEGGFQGSDSGCQACMASTFTCFASAPGANFYILICLGSHTLFMIGYSVSGYDSWINEKTEDSTHVAIQSVLLILEDISVDKRF